MVVLGIISGIIIGTLIVLLQQFTGLIKITQNLAYPVHLTLANVCIVLVTIFILGVAAAKLASTRINAKLIRN